MSSASRGKTGEENRAAVAVSFGRRRRRVRQRRAPPETVGAQPVQDRLGEPGRGLERTGSLGSGLRSPEPVERAWSSRVGGDDVGVGLRSKLRGLPCAGRAGPESRRRRGSPGVERLGDLRPVAEGSLPRARSMMIAFLPSPLSWMSATSATTDSAAGGRQRRQANFLRAVQQHSVEEPTSGAAAKPMQQNHLQASAARWG